MNAVRGGGLLEITSRAKMRVRYYAAPLTAMVNCVGWSPMSLPPPETMPYPFTVGQPFRTVNRSRRGWLAAWIRSFTLLASLTALERRERPPSTCAGGLVWHQLLGSPTLGTPSVIPHSPRERRSDDGCIILNTVPLFRGGKKDGDSFQFEITLLHSLTDHQSGRPA